MSPSGRESDSDVSNYLDGVPVKISERYRPPRKVVLPVGFQHRLGVTLENALRDTAYDFTMARNVVDDSKLRREQKLALRESRKARLALEVERRKAESERELAEQIENFTLKSDVITTECESATVNVPSPPMSPPPVTASQIKTVITKSQFSEILTPQPIPTPSKITSPIVPAKSAFNISDFEADTSSPFDNMELKTINDMEELAHVLQPNGVSDIRPKDSYQYSNYYSQSNTTSNNVSTTEQANNNSVVNTYGAYGHISTVPRGESHLNGPAYASNHQNYMYPSQTQHPQQILQQPAPQQQSSSYYYPNQQTWMYAEQHSSYSYVPPQYDTQMASSKGYAYPASNIPIYSQSNMGLNFPHSNPGDQTSRSRTSKSVPDITEELQKEAAALASPSRSTAVPVPKGNPLPLSHLPTPRPASFGSTGLENWKPWPELDSPAASEDSRPPPSLIKAPPNPLSSLPPGTQQLARQLSEMGFPLARVARACETIGQDQKKVLDYLLQVQKLEERGFPGPRVELAVGKLGLDEAKTLRFLPALGQLLDLGFPEERVSQVLLQFDCDRDKALEALLA